MNGKRQRAPWRNKIRSIEEIKEYLLACRRINPETGCWEWPFSGKSDGSGQMACWIITKKRRPVLVRRIAAYLWLGLDINDRKVVVAPRCENTACFNPGHLFLTTHRERLNSLAVKYGRVLSTEKLKKIIELLKLKMHPRNIAVLTNVHHHAIWRIKTLRGWQRECRSLGWTGDYERTLRKLSDEDVCQIRELLAEGRTQREVAQIYNVHYSLICRIHKGNRHQTALQQEAANVG